jgi:hypothetical protein
VAIVGVVGGVVALGGVAAALAGHQTPRVAPSALAAHQGASTTLATTTTVLPVATTVVVTTTVPLSTTSTTRPAPPPAPQATVPPTTQAPTTTTVVRTAGLQVSPSTAGFPSTPPPYWPMPIVHVTVTNTGTDTVSAVVVHPVGVYSVPSNTCTTLAPGQSCGADVQFCPSSAGHYLNTLQVTGQDAVTGLPVQASATLDGTAT